MPPHLSVSTSNSPSNSTNTNTTTTTTFNTPTRNSSTSTNTPTPAHNISSPSQTPRSQTSRSTSPVPPPVSPITPTLSAAKLASNSHSNLNVNTNANINLGSTTRNESIGSELHTSGKSKRRHQGGKNIATMNNNNNTRTAENPLPHPQLPPNHPAVQAHAHSFRETYSHTQQTPQVSMAQPKPQKINFDENPDVLAMKSTITILQLQAKNAERDMVVLQRIKERAAGDPEGFVGSLMEGERRAEVEAARKKGREARRMARAGEADAESSSDEDEESELDAVKEETDGVATDTKWENLPTLQNIVRCPPVNWAKYGVVGESLDRLHEDQIRRPSEGHLATINADGTTTHRYGDGVKKEYVMQKPLGLNEVVPKKKKKSLPGK